MIPAQHGKPKYKRLDVIIETRTGRRLLVLFVGEEAYFLRLINPPDTGPDQPREPRETAWEHAGCEDATHLVEDGAA